MMNSTMQRVTSAGDMYGDVLVTATAHDGYAIVTCKQLPGGGHWAPPTNEMMRNLVDALAKREGVRRIGRREHVSGWTYRYTLTQ